MKSKNWLQRHQKDIYVKKAKKEDIYQDLLLNLLKLKKNLKLFQIQNKYLN